MVICHGGYELSGKCFLEYAVCHGTRASIVLFLFLSLVIGVYSPRAAV